MDELKLLIGMVNDLPALAIWVLVAFYAYKVVIIGSVYGVIRLAIMKMHDWLTSPKRLDVIPQIEGFTIRATMPALIAQLHRVRGKGINGGTEYIHGADIDWLREAIDDKIAKDQARKEK